jgi:hypothetical protein
MESHHWFFLGMMVAWTPCLVILVVMLCRAKSEPNQTDNTPQSSDIKALPFASPRDYGQISEAGQNTRPNGKLAARVARDADGVVLIRTRTSNSRES